MKQEQKTHQNTNTEALKDKAKKSKFWESWGFLILLCVILPILFRSFVYSPRHIPSGSMKPTLLVGDYIFIQKFAYGYSKYLLPFAHKFDYFDGRIMQDETNKPQRGDIIVFRPPDAPSYDYIKRLVGIAGDTIQMKAGKLYINGMELPREEAGTFTDIQDNNIRTYKRYIEKMPNGKEYYVLDEKYTTGDDTELFKVPENHYFFMGDNRDNSRDSRFSVGYVPEENLIGKAETVFFSNEYSFFNIFNWFSSFRGERFLLDLNELDDATKNQQQND